MTNQQAFANWIGEDGETRVATPIRLAIPEEIKALVAVEFGIGLRDLRSRRAYAQVAKAAAAYLLKAVRDMSQPEIARAMEWASHSTVNEKLKQARAMDLKNDERVVRILGRLRAEGLLGGKNFGETLGRANGCQ